MGLKKKTLWGMLTPKQKMLVIRAFKQGYVSLMEVNLVYNSEVSAKKALHVLHSWKWIINDKNVGGIYRPNEDMRHYISDEEMMDGIQQTLFDTFK